MNASFTDISSSTYHNVQLFTGRRLDEDCGMYYFRNRYYSPGLGRFCERDPIGYADGMNLYAGYFVPGGMDPSGLIMIRCKCTNYFGITTLYYEYDLLSYELPDTFCRRYCDSQGYYYSDGDWDHLEQGEPDEFRETHEEILTATGDGFQAWCDGFIPFWDPFLNSGCYDLEDYSTLGISHSCGVGSRDALLLAWGSGGGVSAWRTWCRNPIQYERGCATVPAHVWKQIAHLDPIAKAQWLRQHGYGALSGFCKGGLSQFGKTIPTGPTPGASLGLDVCFVSRS